jgi:hypothetical protein
MKMVSLGSPSISLEKFLEIVLMWHCNGDVPMDRISTQTFIEEDDGFEEFLYSIRACCIAFGLKEPPRREVVMAMHKLYEQEHI